MKVFAHTACISLLLMAGASAASFQRPHGKVGFSFHRRGAGATESRGQYCCKLIQATNDLQPSGNVEQLCANPGQVYPAASFCGSGNDDSQLVDLSYNIGSTCHLYSSGDVEGARRCFTTGDCGYKADASGYSCATGVPVKAGSSSSPASDSAAANTGKSSSVLKAATTTSPAAGSKSTPNTSNSAAPTTAPATPNNQQGKAGLVFPATYVSQAATAIKNAGSQLGTDAARVASALTASGAYPQQQIDVMEAYRKEMKSIYDNYVDFLNSAEAAASYTPAPTPPASAAPQSPTTKSGSSSAKPASSTAKPSSSTKSASKRSMPTDLAL